MCDSDYIIYYYAAEEINSYSRYNENYLMILFYRQRQMFTATKI